MSLVVKLHSSCSVPSSITPSDPSSLDVISSKNTVDVVKMQGVGGGGGAACMLSQSSQMRLGWQFHGRDLFSANAGHKKASEVPSCATMQGHHLQDGADGVFSRNGSNCVRLSPSDHT